MKPDSAIPLYSFQQAQPAAPPTAPLIEVLSVAEMLQGEGIATFPHRHRFYELVWFRAGAGRHTVDFRDYPVAPGTLFCLAPGQVHHFGGEVEPEGVLVMFTDDFLANAPDGISSLTCLRLFDTVQSDYQPLRVPPSEAAALDALLGQLAAEFARPPDFATAEVLRSYLRLFLAGAERLRRQQPGLVLNSMDPAHATFLRFRQLLDAEFSRLHGVADYAARLSLTPRRLTAATQAVVGQSAGVLIDERRALEAKRLLTHSALSAKEVAFALGFEDPSYFHKFFKKVTGYTAQAFRRELGEKYL
ncbi:helix-turn-helix domain-containing protein [Hymenobacter weizhouensis]|uniref:helix-turn-helix domain-containing protein n=1 Tax=Hymenobacter sp. YIM 151500-1 TaxID=2987689 RepID=UPI002226FC70|nr:AraC family transcriptional regulator [Hymenobacter sp. YIM 151500-1]UYZ64488.1 AraC family transcriptional regulator [Hymenobacter sp. YIM 151500-1]